jgi:hypothetical protein
MSKGVFDFLVYRNWMDLILLDLSWIGFLQEIWDLAFVKNLFFE